jgi:hypothetical protein
MFWWYHRRGVLRFYYPYQKEGTRIRGASRQYWLGVLNGLLVDEGRSRAMA